MDRLTFRHAIARHMGRVITPELCARIEAEASVVPDQRLPIANFPTLQADEYEIRAERLADVLPEMHPLHEAHFRETEKHRAGLTLGPAYDAMLADEMAGRLLQFTVRRSGELVGGLRLYVVRSRHTTNLLAVEDTLYIAPAHRGALLGLHLVRYAEERLRELGVREIEADSKVINGADVLMRRRRFDLVAYKFHKTLEE